MGHVNAILKASYICEELCVVVIHQSEIDQEICRNDRFKYLVPEIRARWITGLTKDMAHINILQVEEVLDKEGNIDFEASTQKIFNTIGKKIDALFHTDLNYFRIIRENYPAIESLLDQYDFKKFTISSTQIRREGVFEHWDDLPSFVRPYYVKKVVIVGTESSGKSTLTRNLAKLYNTNYVEEYGRVLCENMGGYDGIFTPDLFPVIAYGHKMDEFEKIRYSNKLLFVDTEIIVTQYFSELFSGKDPILESMAEHNYYDLWLYLEPDVVWVADGYRTYGREQDRRYNNEKLKKMLDDREIAYHTISGSYIERISKAVKLIDKLLE